MQIVGQKNNIDMINSWNKMPNFTIIQGDKDTGKTTLVFYMCQRFGLYYVKVKNGVNDIRQLLKMMTPNSNTVFHLVDFDKASLQAKNALLKITEETPVGNYIVITGARQLKTLESRAKKIVMSAYKFEELTDFMLDYIPNFDIQQRLYKAGINTPSKVIMYSKVENIGGLLSLAFDVFNSITNLSVNFCIEIVNLFDSRYDGVDMVQLFLEMLIHIIEYSIVHKCIYDYYDILNILLQAKESLEKDSTLNRKFLLYNTLYGITLYNLKAGEIN